MSALAAVAAFWRALRGRRGLTVVIEHRPQANTAGGRVLPLVSLRLPCDGTAAAVPSKRTDDVITVGHLVSPVWAIALRSDGWSVTHVPSGAAISSTSGKRAWSLADALTIADRLAVEHPDFFRDLAYAEMPHPATASLDDFRRYKAIRAIADAVASGHPEQPAQRVTHRRLTVPGNG